GPEVTLLSASHEYFRTAPAPDYWAISPYYVPQKDDRSCSISSVTMMMNAARVGMKLTADDELVTQQALMKKVPQWEKAVGSGGRGATLDELKYYIEESLKAYGFEKFTVEAVHTDDTSTKTQAALHRALVENEHTANDFIIINFIQGVFTGDAQ